MIIQNLEWLRSNCMEVFHYCAERLKDIPLFTTCKDEDVFQQERKEKMGSIYNDFDFNPASSVEYENFNDFESMESFTPINPEVTVSQDTINELYHS